MAVYLHQQVLNGGVISPLMYGRFDQPRYQTGAYTMHNAVPLPQGGVTRRPGMLFAGLAKDQAAPRGAVRLLPFVYDGQYRMLELAPGVCRVWFADGSRVRKNGNPYEFAVPFTANDLNSMGFAQSADVIFCASRARKPGKIIRYGDTDWRYETLTFTPKTPAPAAPGLAVGGSVAGNGSQTYSYKVVAVNSTTGELSLPSPAVDTTCSSLSTTYYIDITITPVAGCNEYRVYKKKSGSYGFIGRIVDGGTTFRDANIGPDLGDTPPEKKTPFEAAGNYPGVVFFHQQRLGFAATSNKPLTTWLSQSANFENFSASLPPRDDDGMEATITGQRQSRILWCESEGKSLLIGTSGGEWAMEAAQGGVFSPANHGFYPQSDAGSFAGLGALRAGGGICFAQRGGSTVRSLNYAVDEDKYKPQDISILASHLLADKHITSWAWQALPYGVVWASLNDGTMAGVTLLKEHDVIGWHSHDTDGFIENVAVLPSAGGECDLLWLVVVRTVNGQAQRCIEIMAPYFQSEDKETAFFLDSGVSQFSAGEIVVRGLGHLEGRTVAVYADGYVHPARTVLQGVAALEHPASVAHAGLPYTTIITPTMPEPQLPDGSPFGRLKKVNAVKVRVYQTMEFTVQLGKHNPVQGVYSSYTVPQEKLPEFCDYADVDITLAGGWQSNVAVTLNVSGPGPATFLALQTALEIGQGGKGHQT